jgi:hypothetical protein
MAVADALAIKRDSSSAAHTSSAALVAVLAGIPVLAAAWALLSPNVVLSHEMTWDFLFNLAGAWQLQHGHIAHLDFHEPVGELNFLLTWLGFGLVGPTPFAFLAGTTFVALGVFISATLAASRRLAAVPAVIFVVFTSLLVLMPANVGDLPNAYSFAMSYNRYGWSALCIVALILFLPPPATRGVAIDLVNAGLLLTALFYLKVTYFAAGLALLGLAIVICRHVRAHLPAWAAVGGIVLANALAPWNYPYLIDILEAVRAGAVRNSLSVHLNNVFASAEGYAPYVAALVVAGWMWVRGAASPRLPLAVAGILAIGAFTLSQNSQSHGLPLGIVIAFLLYGEIRRRVGPSVPLMSMLMVFPLFSIGTSAISLVGYHWHAERGHRLLVVERTQLKGLAVPAEGDGLLTAFAEGRTDYSLLNRARATQPRFELSSAEYVGTLSEAAAVLDDGRRRPGGVVVLDQVNPLPFMLGWAPPRGGNLWSGPSAPVQPAGEVFAEADYVLIPKFSTYSAWTNQAQLEYGAYLAQNFAAREESRSWIVLSRRRSPDLEQRNLPSAAPRAAVW